MTRKNTILGYATAVAAIIASPSFIFFHILRRNASEPEGLDALHARNNEPRRDRKW